MTTQQPLNRWSSLLIALLGIHIIWGAARIPGKVYGKRFERIRHYLEVGGPAYHLDNDYRQGAAEVRLLLAETDENCILLWRGEWRGSLEFVPALIAPRLLVAENTCPADATDLFGRPLGQGQLADGRNGIFVLVGGENRLNLELR